MEPSMPAVHGSCVAQGYSCRAIPANNPNRACGHGDLPVSATGSDVSLLQLPLCYSCI